MNQQSDKLTMDSVPEAVTPEARPRPRVTTPPSRKKPRIPVAVLVCGALIIGLALGGFLMRQRMKAREVIAAVNGTIITQDDFFKRLQSEAGDKVIHQMVAEDLQLQYAQKVGLAPTDAEVDKRYLKISSQHNFQDILAQNGQNAVDFKRSLRVKLAQAAVVTRNITITEKDVYDFYKRQTDKTSTESQFYYPDTAVIQVIVTQNQAEGQKAASELLDSVPFDIVAKRYSVDESYKDGGVLAPVQRGRTNFARVAGMDQAIFKLNVGEQLGPQRFGNRWWIIRCKDKMAEVTKPFKEVKEECRIGAALDKGIALNAKKIETDFDTFQASSNIQAFWAQYRKSINSQ